MTCGVFGHEQKERPAKSRQSQDPAGECKGNSIQGIIAQEERKEQHERTCKF